MRNAWVGRFSSLLLILLCLGCEWREHTVFDQKQSYTLNGSEVFVARYSTDLDLTENTFNKEPLVIVHGGPVMDQSYLLPHLLTLSEDYQLIFYDQRACGRSAIEVDSATMNLDGFVEDIELLRKELGFEKINLLGHSWGGLLATMYGIKYSQNLDKLILSNSMAPSAMDWMNEGQKVAAANTPQDAADTQAIINSGDLQSDDPREAIRSLMLLGFRHQVYDTASLSLLNLYVPEDYMARSAVFGLLGPELQGYDLYAELGNITVPTLLVYGEIEHAPEIFTDKMLERIPDARLEIIKEAGHFPFIEQPGRFRKRVLDFLKE